VRCKRTGRPRAVKVFEKREFRKSNMGLLINKIQHEVRVLRRINHPNLLNLFEVHETKDKICIVTELIEGPNVGMLQNLGKYLEEKYLRSILLDCLQALKYLFSKGVIHRNINPKKLILTKNSLPGLKNKVKLIGYSDCSFYLIDTDLVEAGTAGFIAPEVLNNQFDPLKANDPKRDIFSLGAVIYYFATKNFVFDIRSKMSLFESNMKGEVSLKHPQFKNLSTPCKENMVNI